MCIAIVATAGKKLTEDMLRQCWNSNPDGGGYAWAKNGELQIRKGFMNLKEMTENYIKDADENPDCNFLIHFRIGTSGGKTADNTHPFMGKECAVIHNGVLFTPPYSSLRSDTRTLVEDAAEYLTKDNVNDKLEKISKFVGNGNKLCFLFKDGSYAIANEKQGDWHEGVWYSNGGFRPGLRSGTGVCSISSTNRMMS